MSNTLRPGGGAAAEAGRPSGISLQRRPNPVEAAIRAVLMASALLSVAITFGIIAALIRPVIDFFREVPSATSSRPRASSRCCRLSPVRR